MERDVRNAMLAEHYQPLIYGDFTHFRERPFAGKYVNVTDIGYRKSLDQGPWPPNPNYFNAFFFGGSTTFGCGLADDQTLPSCVQREFAKYSTKRVCAYNFGVGYYYSTQERLCCEKLLMALSPTLSCLSTASTKVRTWKTAQPEVTDFVSRSSKCRAAASSPRLTSGTGKL